MKDCKRCLLLQTGGEVTLKEIMSQLNSVEKELRADDETYKKRLSECKKCDNLLAGMCTKCGCYVEYRAGIKNKDCPDCDNQKW